MHSSRAREIKALFACATMMLILRIPFDPSGKTLA
jgi:hypothetical protein